MKNDSISYEIRPGSNADIPAIKGIIFDVLREYGLKPDETGKDADLNNIEENYFNNNGFFGVVIDGDKRIVGTFGLYRLSEQVCELRKMYLVKSARGRGCGRKILEYCIALAKEYHYATIRLETIAVLKDAIRLYKKFQFVETTPDEVNERVDQAFERVLR